MNMDNSVVIPGEGGIRGLNGNVKKIKFQFQRKNITKEDIQVMMKTD